MSEVFVLGVSHHTSPVALREKLAVDGKALGETAVQVAKAASLQEVLIVSTCNRVEVYGGKGDEAAVAAWLRERVGGDPIDDYVYVHRDADAVRHAFRVASSLDSMVVGEPQILGQVKEAYAEAKRAGSIGSLLDRCFTTAFSVAKKVRNETRIAEGSVSVSSIAGDLAKKIFDDLHGRRVLLIGAGEMGEAAARRLLAAPEAAEPFAPVPYVWTDQYDRKLQIAGHIRPDDLMKIIQGSLEERRFVAIFGREGRLTGALAMNRPAAVIRLKQRIARGDAFADVVAGAQ